MKDEIEALRLANAALQEQLLDSARQSDIMLSILEIRHNELRAADQRHERLSVFFQRIIDAVGSLVIVLSNEGHIVQANAKSIQILGEHCLPKSGHPPSILDAWLDPYEAEKLHTALPSLPWPVISTLAETIRGHGIYHTEHRLRDVNGKMIDFLVEATVMHDRRGKEEGFVINATDIRLFKKNERELKRYRDDLQIMVDQKTLDLQQSISTTKKALTDLERHKFVIDQHAIVTICGLDGRITYGNNKFAEISGYFSNEYIGQDHIILNSGYHPHGFFKDMYDTLDRGEVWHAEICNRKKDGHLYWVDSTVATLFGDDGQPYQYISVQTDITKRKYAEEAAHSANRAKSEFLANMSHEIRTPLNAVIGLAHIGLRDNLNSTIGKHFKHIANAGSHLLSIINDILDISKIEAGKLNIEKSPFALHTAIAAIVDVISSQAEAKGLSLIISLAPNLPTWVEGDELRITQIIINLLANAIKFTSSGEIKLEVSRIGTLTYFLIHDTGIGMHAAQLERIFQPFEQADGSTTRTHGGTGLGLSISINLARLMGGDISVQSTPDVGSTFTLHLNLPIVAENTQFTALQYKEGQPLQGLSILAAEDVEMNRIILEDILNYEGANVVMAENGEQLVEILQNAGVAAFHIVLMDIQMPLMDGFEATRRTLMLAPNMPIIGVTAHALSEERSKCLAAGMVDVVTKPIDKHILLDTIIRRVERNTLKIPIVADGNTNDKPIIPEIKPSDPASQQVSTVFPNSVSPDTPIDWPAINIRFNGRQAFIKKLVASVLEHHAETPMKLRNAAQQGDTALLIMTAHSIKGVSGNLEAHHLHELAITFEAMARTGEDITTDSVETFALALEVVLGELKNIASCEEDT